MSNAVRKFIETWIHDAVDAGKIVTGWTSVTNVCWPNVKFKPPNNAGWIGPTVTFSASYYSTLGRRNDDTGFINAPSTTDPSEAHLLVEKSGELIPPAGFNKQYGTLSIIISTPTCTGAGENKEISDKLERMFDRQTPVIPCPPPARGNLGVIFFDPAIGPSSVREASPEKAFFQTRLFVPFSAYLF